MAIIDLRKKHCVPCEGGMPPLTKEQVAEYAPQAPGWNVAADNKKITKEFTFKDFKGAMAFINRVAEIAESEGHHPDIYIFYNLVRFELTTHAMHGLSENDFILAAKINALLS
ncbi:MAG TPA: 4a-hydroxytetrahydrobiopterin dehydratase [Candidatus Paceibacterota bacterium]|nr:4a-hydroxytetrahydrobiopterin dehydratase [Candidatus Paceibacterota bacterium]